MLDIHYRHDPKTGKVYIETSIEGKALLTTPQLNKGTAFTKTERRIFNLEGKLPSRIETLEEQANRAYLQYSSYRKPINKNIFLNELHDTNQVLFYYLVKKHIEEMLPIIYTPTVGDAVEVFSKKFQHARGLYISYEDKDRIEDILDNRSNPDIDLIVVTDGSGVLGIGDQGVGAMMIPVAKLMVYCLCGGINPLRTLPILLDLGTNNKLLRSDPLYLGWDHDRIEGEKYNLFIDRFVTAVKRKFPHIFLHWEDFDYTHAHEILNRYQNSLCTFNDDIQGTGVVSLSALLTAVKANGSTLNEQRIIVFGAGTAGMGITHQIAEGMMHEGMDEAEARKQFWLIDRPGLLTSDSDYLTPSQIPYVRDDWEGEEKQLLDVIKKVKPTVLIGSSTVTGAFNEEIVREMAKHTEHPIILPLSNPTRHSEANPADLIQWTDGKARVATGSPFDPFEFKGRMVKCALCNNALVFPGIALGLTAVGAKRVTSKMLWEACKALTKCAPLHKSPEIPLLLPSIKDAHIAAKAIAMAIGESAIEEGLAKEIPHRSVKERVEEKMWEPAYVPFKKRDVCA